LLFVFLMSPGKLVSLELRVVCCYCGSLQLNWFTLCPSPRKITTRCNAQRLSEHLLQPHRYFSSKHNSRIKSIANMTFRPMKKKGGTAGIPRPSGERGSPTSNSLPNDQVSFTGPLLSSSYPSLFFLHCNCWNVRKRPIF